jgi:hypothetical protein
MGARLIARHAAPSRHHRSFAPRLLRKNEGGGRNTSYSLTEGPTE